MEAGLIDPSAQVLSSLIGALEYDLTVRDSDINGSQEQARDNEARRDDGEHEVSDTESEGAFHRPRSLRLTWNSGVNQEWHRDARAAEKFVRDLAQRVGVVPSGGAIPGVIRRQRWSPLNVPLMWEAAGQNLSSPVLDWLVHCLSGSAHEFP